LAGAGDLNTNITERRRTSRANNRATQTAINIRNKFVNFFVEN
jgi:hypothetical protein